MSAPLAINPETAEILAAQARTHGLSVDEYLRSLLLQQDEESHEKPLYESATSEE